jgi:hypothetical protein
MGACSMTKLGATRKFPKGKLNQFDEGELVIQIGHNEDRTVRIDFGKKVAWIGFEKENAIQFALKILEHAGVNIQKIKEN